MVYTVGFNSIIDGAPRGSSKIYWDGSEVNISAFSIYLDTDGSHTLAAQLIDNSSQYKFTRFHAYWDAGPIEWLDSPTTVTQGGFINVHYITPDPLQVYCNPNNVTIKLGESVTFTAGAIGGIEPYSFEWNIPVVGKVTGSSITVTPTTVGPMTIGLAVIDARSWVATASVNLTVNAPATHTLTVNALADSTSVTVSFTVNGVQASTPYSQTLVEGSYSLQMPSEITFNENAYSFKQWSDGAVDPLKTVTLTSNIALTASFQLKETPPTPILDIPWWLIILALAGVGIGTMAYLREEDKKKKGRRKKR